MNKSSSFPKNDGNCVLSSHFVFEEENMKLGTPVAIRNVQGHEISYSDAGPVGGPLIFVAQ